MTSLKVDKHIGSIIRTRRLLNNKSLKEIGERLGISFQQMQKYEKGINRLSSAYLFQIADLLNTPIENFFPDSNKGKSLKEEQESFQQGYATEGELTSLIKNYSKIESKEVRKKILELVKSLAD